MTHCDRYPNLCACPKEVGMQCHLPGDKYTRKASTVPMVIDGSLSPNVPNKNVVVWESFNDSRDKYIAGIDPIPMPGDGSQVSEHAIVIGRAGHGYDHVTEMNIDAIIEKYRHVLVPEVIEKMREHVIANKLDSIERLISEYGHMLTPEEIEQIRLANTKTVERIYALKLATDYHIDVLKERYDSLIFPEIVERMKSNAKNPTVQESQKLLEGRRAVPLILDELDPTDPTVRARFAEYEKLMNKRQEVIITGEDGLKKLREIACCFGIDKNIYPHVRKTPIEDWEKKEYSDRVRRFMEEVDMAFIQGREPKVDFVFDEMKPPVRHEGGPTLLKYIEGDLSPKHETIFLSGRGCGRTQTNFERVFGSVFDDGNQSSVFRKFFKRDKEMKKRRNMFDKLDLYEARKHKDRFRRQQKQKELILQSIGEELRHELMLINRVQRQGFNLYVEGVHLK